MKERIVGAVVLVLVVVLVVPVFLDGPPGEDEILTQSVRLPGQDEQRMQTVVLDRDRDAPVPAVQSSVPEPTAAGPAATVPAPVRPASEPGVEESPAEAARPAPVGASTTGMWAVQLGSFGNQANAERLAADLRTQGYAAFLSKLSTPDGELHRVRVGPQKDRDSAEAMASRLKESGHEGKVLPHP